MELSLRIIITLRSISVSQEENDMQYRMKTHPLSDDRLNDLLNRVETGSLATMNEDGTPYNTPVHFVYKIGRAHV